MTIKLGPLTAVAIGDTYGAQFEYRRDEWAHLNTGEFYSQHKTHLDLLPGKYTDDTQMSLAIAELMLTKAPCTEETLDNKFLEVYFRDPRVGYAKGMLAAMQSAKTGNKSLSEVCAEFGKSQKSGAAMRATPLGLCPTVGSAASLARFQGRITHTGSALDAAEAAAIAAHFMLYNIGPRTELPGFLADMLHEDIWLEPWQGKVGAPGMESTRAALTAVVQATSLRDLLIRCCAFTGDVDTVAAIAMGCAWNYADLENDLPDSLQTGMENGPCGWDYLVNLDTQLLAVYPLPQRRAA